MPPSVAGVSKEKSALPCGSKWTAVTEADAGSVPRSARAGLSPGLSVSASSSSTVVGPAVSRMVTSGDVETSSSTVAAWAAGPASASRLRRRARHRPLLIGSAHSAPTADSSKGSVAASITDTTRSRRGCRRGSHRR